MSQSDWPNLRSLAYAVAAIALAAVLGFASGALMARIAPDDKFSWAGLAIAPLWIVLEFFFEGVVEVLGSYSKAVRVISLLALLAGFYIAWFALREVTP